MKRPHIIAIYRGYDRDWRWRITSRNGQIIGASSEGYVRIRACEHNLATITGVCVRYNRDHLYGETVAVPARGIVLWQGHEHLDVARASESTTLYGMQQS